MSKNSRYYDRIFGLIIVIFAITYGYLSTKFTAAFGMEEAIGPKTFPFIISILLGLSGFWLIIKPQAGETWPHGKMWLELLGITLALIGFAFSLEILGFILASILCCSYISWRMGAKPLRAMISAVIYCAILYFLFNNLLQLYLPKGFLGGLL